MTATDPKPGAISLTWIESLDPLEMGHYEVYEDGDHVGTARQEWHQGNTYWRHTYRGETRGLRYDTDVQEDFEAFAKSWRLRGMPQPPADEIPY